MSRTDKALTAQSKSARYHWLAVRSSGRLAMDLQAQAKHWAHVARSNLFRVIGPKERVT